MVYLDLPAKTLLSCIDSAAALFPHISIEQWRELGRRAYTAARFNNSDRNISRIYKRANENRGKPLGPSTTWVLADPSLFFFVWLLLFAAQSEYESRAQQLTRAGWLAHLVALGIVGEPQDRSGLAYWLAQFGLQRERIRGRTPVWLAASICAILRPSPIVEIIAYLNERFPKQPIFVRSSFSNRLKQIRDQLCLYLNWYDAGTQDLNVTNSNWSHPVLRRFSPQEAIDFWQREFGLLQMHFQSQTGPRESFCSGPITDSHDELLFALLSRKCLDTIKDYEMSILPESDHPAQPPSKPPLSLQFAEELKAQCDEDQKRLAAPSRNVTVSLDGSPARSFNPGTTYAVNRSVEVFFNGTRAISRLLPPASQRRKRTYAEYFIGQNHIVLQISAEGIQVDHKVLDSSLAWTPGWRPAIAALACILFLALYIALQPPLPSSLARDTTIDETQLGQSETGRLRIYFQSPPKKLPFVQYDVELSDDRRASAQTSGVVCATSYPPAAANYLLADCPDSLDQLNVDKLRARVNVKILGIPVRFSAQVEFSAN